MVNKRNQAAVCVLSKTFEQRGEREDYFVLQPTQRLLMTSFVSFSQSRYGRQRQDFLHLLALCTVIGRASAGRGRSFLLQAGFWLDSVWLNHRCRRKLQLPEAVGVERAESQKRSSRAVRSETLRGQWLRIFVCSTCHCSHWPAGTPPPSRTASCRTASPARTPSWVSGRGPSPSCGAPQAPALSHAALGRAWGPRGQRSNQGPSRDLYLSRCWCGDRWCCRTRRRGSSGPHLEGRKIQKVMKVLTLYSRINT